MKRRAFFQRILGTTIGAALAPVLAKFVPTRFAPKYYEYVAEITWGGPSEVAALMAADMENAAQTLSNLIAVDLYYGRTHEFEDDAEDLLDDETLPENPGADCDRLRSASRRLAQASG